MSLIEACGVTNLTGCSQFRDMEHLISSSYYAGKIITSLVASKVAVAHSLISTVMGKLTRSRLSNPYFWQPAGNLVTIVLSMLPDAINLLIANLAPCL